VSVAMCVDMCVAVVLHHVLQRVVSVAMCVDMCVAVVLHHVLQRVAVLCCSV